MKPFKGEIHNWSTLRHTKELYSIFGKPIDHPTIFNWIRTSPVVKREGDMVETENSLYRLVGEEQPLPEVLRRRSYDGEHRS